MSNKKGGVRLRRPEIQVPRYSTLLCDSISAVASETLLFYILVPLN